MYGLGRGKVLEKCRERLKYLREREKRQKIVYFFSLFFFLTIGFLFTLIQITKIHSLHETKSNSATREIKQPRLVKIN